MNSNKNLEEKKYQIKLEVVEVGKTNSPAKIIKQTRKNIKKLILNKLSGRTGECQINKKSNIDRIRV